MTQLKEIKNEINEKADQGNTKDVAKLKSSGVELATRDFSAQQELSSPVIGVTDALGSIVLQRVCIRIQSRKIQILII